MSRCNDYCCNNGCNQGRACPARPARVAKIGKRIHLSQPEPLRGTPWRRHLKDLVPAALLTIAVMLVSGVTVALLR